MFYWDIVHICCCSVAKSCWCLATPWTGAHQAPLPSTISWSLLNSCLLGQWCYLTVSSSAVLFSFCLQSFPASRSLPKNWLFPSNGQIIGASGSASGFPMNIQGWFLLRLTGLISLQCKRLSRAFNTTVWKHQFFGAQKETTTHSSTLAWKTPWMEEPRRL